MGPPHEGSIQRPIAPLANTLTKKSEKDKTDLQCKIIFNSNHHVNLITSKKEREMFYLTTHSTHFIYCYMASDIWLRTILIVRKETRCHHIDYSSINSKGSFICTIPDRITPTTTLLHQSWSTDWNEITSKVLLLTSPLNQNLLSPPGKLTFSCSEPGLCGGVISRLCSSLPDDRFLEVPSNPSNRTVENN